MTAALDTWAQPCTLEGFGVRLLPMDLTHEADLIAAASDGALWNIRVTSVPEPDQTRAYIEQALEQQAQGHRVPFVVQELVSGEIVGSTSYHDILPETKRLEIGWTWYAKRWQKSHINVACKYLLLRHGFVTLDAKVLGFRTDNFNFTSQGAIQRLGARKDGVLRGHALRRDGSVRDTVMYSIIRGEWPEVEIELLARLARKTNQGPS